MGKRILILCTGNSCRSQMAEGFFKSFDDGLKVYSAGLAPAEKVSEGANTVMNEIGIDISGQKPENVSKFLEMPFDYVITVCENAKETCPVFTGDVKHRLHIGFKDPAEATGTKEEVLAVFRKVRDEIKQEMERFYAQNLKV